LETLRYQKLLDEHKVAENPEDVSFYCRLLHGVGAIEGHLEISPEVKIGLPLLDIDDGSSCSKKTVFLRSKGP